MRLVLSGVVAILLSSVVQTTAASGALSQSTPAPRHEDCLRYDPTALAVVPQGPERWAVRDSRRWMMSFFDKTDADRALMLARGYTEECFIGRHPATQIKVPPSDKLEYHVTYWKGATGHRIALRDEHCTTYVPSHLAATDRGSEGWTVSDGGGGFTLTVDNERDAAALLDLARQHTAHCTIGYRSPPGTHIMFRNRRVDYWK